MKFKSEFLLWRIRFEGREEEANKGWWCFSWQIWPMVMMVTEPREEEE